MPLREKTIVEKRLEAIAMVKLGCALSDVARRYEVSRPTLYEWLRRDEAGEDLQDRSRAPHSCPHRTESWIEQRLIDERLKWKFGSKKILTRLQEEDPSVGWPSRATADAIFKRAGLVQARRRVRRVHAPTTRPNQIAKAPGDLTTVDFKGEFRLRNGRYCFPLTVVDAFSRYLIACEALGSTQLVTTWAVLQRVFREHGLPRAMQSDNGVPFGAHGNGRFSTLSVRLMRLGVQPIFSRPGKPQDNGAHERMHRTLKQHVIDPASTLRAQQRRFDTFRQMFNHERPHEGISMKRPARLYHPVSRPFPESLPELDYEARFETRLVDTSGMIRWRGASIFIGHPFAGQRIGLEPIDYALWNVHFGRFVVGVLDEKQSLFT
jgi:putative transposase